MDHLRRSHAPISGAAWQQIDEEAARTLRNFLTARAVLDFTGPKGWVHSSEPLGRVRPAAPVVAGVKAGVRVSQPLVEIRTPFTLSLEETDRAERGAPDVDLDAVVDAARLAALAEDQTIFHGHEAFGIEGIVAASPHDPLDIADDYSSYPGVVARAVAALRRDGVGGPYAIALGDRCYTGVIETTEHGGYPVLEHVKLIVGGPVVWAPAIDGAVVLSLRGGDYEIVSGQDFAVGFQGQRDDAIDLYLEETFTLVVHQNDAAIHLRYT